MDLDVNSWIFGMLYWCIFASKMKFEQIIKKNP
jgi:hypothetical protein